jgi:hypothetical protein
MDIKPAASDHQRHRPMTEDYTLAYGTHATAGAGRCAMEWVSHLAGEPHSDAPACVSPVLRALCISLNDDLADAPRQRLRPYLARTIGTAGDGLDDARAWMAMDWLVHNYAPSWLELARLPDQAAALAQRPAIVDERTLRASLGDLGAARRAARGARMAVFCAEGNPVTAWASAVAGGRTGREAAWVCAGAAAGAAARVAVSDDAGNRTRALTRAAAGDAAAVAVRRVRADDVCGAPSGHSAVQVALGPTLQALADSAIALLERMLPTETVDLPVPAAAQLAPTT